MSHPFESIHPLGECKQVKKSTENNGFSLDTYAGRLHIEWDPQAAVTPLGQLPFFIEFLKTTKLNVDVQSGKKISGCYSMPGLWKLLESIPKDQWPQFIRGDISYGTERIMRESELRDVKYLFKLKCSSKIKALIKRNMEINSDWEKAGHGYEGVEDSIQLQGWSCPRRVIILRRRIAKRILVY